MTNGHYHLQLTFTLATSPENKTYQLLVH